MSTLELQKRTRVVRDLPSGSYQTPVVFLDFVVDGQSLYDVFQVTDNVSCLAWFPAISAVVKDTDRLLLRSPGDLPNDRRSLYVCPECGDIGCGAVTLVIEAQRDKIIWREFGYENNWDGKCPDLQYFSNLGPFVFDRTQYTRTLEEGTRRLLAGG